MEIIMSQIDRRRFGPLMLALLLAGCSPDDLIGNGELPPDAQDPGVTRTAAGAMSAYRGTLVRFREAMGGGEESSTNAYAYVSGLLSDELGAIGGTPGIDFLGNFVVDSRSLPEFVMASGGFSTEANLYVGLYSKLHIVRGQAQQTRGLLQAYAPDSSPGLRGHLFALEGYSDLYLADGFCSGIPLSTIEYGGDYTIQPPFSRDQVYLRARELFDTALVLSTDSARILNLALVGKARALLALGEFALAGQAAAQVPDGFTYKLQFADLPGSQRNFGSGWNFVKPLQVVSPFTGSIGMTDREGGNGLDYLTSSDPRLSNYLVVSPFPFPGPPSYLPIKYDPTGASPITVAGWVEARLIEAEAALQGGDPGTWLTKINLLRETAITPALPDTADPVDPAERVNLLFRERAFWLFLEGHRQGDLRRMVRQYGRDPTTIYPTGPYPGGGGYGNDVTLPVPSAERNGNKFFHGCLSRGA